MRDHKPIILDKFNGLWDRGDVDNTPIDHFSDCLNVRYVGYNSFATRYGIDPHQNVVGPLGNIVRIYNYVTQDKNTLLALTWDGSTGKIYHVVDATTVTLILTVTGMSDFAFIPFAGRAYISPFGSFTTGGITIEKGLSGEKLYVYLGTGSPARAAAGSTPAGTVTVANGAAGNMDGGLKVFAVVGETDSGFLSAPCAFKAFACTDLVTVSFTNVPTFTGTQWTKRHLVATKTITDYNGDTQGYQFFFIPGADINDNVTTSLANVGFFDADLLEDASHLLDNYSTIPAGAVLSIYHGRLSIATSFTDINTILVSASGEPEAISKIDGFLVPVPDGNPVTNGQEMRDVFYTTKRNRTTAFVDNGQEPALWSSTAIDLALGCGVHGIATVIDSGSTSTDFLLIASYLGIILFNGRYNLPELTWKITNRWLGQDRNKFRLVQMVNDPINKLIYCTMTDGNLLIGDYNNGMDPKKIRWGVWNFTTKASTIALVNINDLIIGSAGI